jgi:hypothetical protein
MTLRQATSVRVLVIRTSHLSARSAVPSALPFVPEAVLAPAPKRNNRHLQLAQMSPVVVDSDDFDGAEGASLAMNKRFLVASLICKVRA